MQRHTYSMVMACVRLVRGMCSAVETWARISWDSQRKPGDVPMDKSDTEE